MFTLHTSTATGRSATLHTAHGDLTTPFFMPCATAGALKGLTFEDHKALGGEILLMNTYHLHLTPGEEIVRQAGGLHTFAGWDRPILTDSGGFQVFSLESLRKISEEGVTFKDHRSGAERFLGPIEAMRIQHALGADIIMCFDECPPSTAPRAEQISAVDRTLRWAKVCKEEHERLKNETNKRNNRNNTNISLYPKDSLDSSLSSGSFHSYPLLFGIVQGGLEKDLRKKCAEELIAIGFDGYAVGGLAVGESEEEMFDVLDTVCPLLPEDKPRYLMGVGELTQIKIAVAKGIDMMDCVAPTREARHGNIWMSDGTKLKIRRAEYATDFSPIDPDSPAPSSRKHSKAYLHHLLKIGERFGETLACLQNLGVTLETVRTLRTKIEES
ncbi:MAG: tRNA guanosine(34) transglycosylase Tgt [Candidatus Peribacteraceae bacterium]